MVYNGGNVYVGQWEGDYMHGTGTFTHGPSGGGRGDRQWIQPGDQYKGPFDGNGFDGIGQWTHKKDGKTERAEWKEDKFIGWPDRT
jgi:hypothetical protein